jgi:hypothetical protein
MSSTDEKLNLQQDSRSQKEVGAFFGVPEPKKYNWKIIYVLIGLLAVIGITLSLLYAEKPKKYNVLPKRKTPFARSVYAVICSPLTPQEAKLVTQAVAKDVNTNDSSDINMVIGSSKIYKRFASAKEFLGVLDSTIAISNDIKLEKQAVLMNQVAQVLLKDTLTTRIHLIGSLASEDVGSVVRKLNNAAGVFVQRNAVIGKVEFVSHLTPKDSPAVKEFLHYFERQGLNVTLSEE